MLVPSWSLTSRWAISSNNYEFLSDFKDMILDPAVAY